MKNQIANDAWNTWVGWQSPEEFMAQSGSDSPEQAAVDYVRKIRGNPDVSDFNADEVREWERVNGCSLADALAEYIAENIQARRSAEIRKRLTESGLY